MHSGSGGERPPRQRADDHPLTGKRSIIPPMAYGSARLFAAALRSLGVDAALTPPSQRPHDANSARSYTSGDECYPAKVTIGDFMRVLERPDADPARTVFFMPTADGPCRFGQYAAYMRRLLDAHGFPQVEVLSPTSRNAYGGLGIAGAPVRPHRPGARWWPPTSCRSSCCSTARTSAGSAPPTRRSRSA